MEEKVEEKVEKVDVSDAESWKKCADPSKEWLEEGENAIKGSTKSRDTIMLAVSLTMSVKGGLWVNMEEESNEISA